MSIKKILVLILAIASVQVATAQVWFTKTGVISIYSHTEVEDIKANNFEVVSFLDAAKGELRFQLLIKGFQFPKAAMQQHFNSEAYMNSDQFPKSEFKGSIDNLSAINFSKDGNYAVTVSGDLTMHGVTKKIKQGGTISVKAGKISANTVFNVKRTDFDITVPKFNAAKIADEIQVTVKCDYAPYTK
jgi:polyisoprenoid-binding protein YceI